MILVLLDAAEAIVKDYNGCTVESDPCEGACGEEGEHNVYYFCQEYDEHGNKVGEGSDDWGLEPCMMPACPATKPPSGGRFPFDKDRIVLLVCV